MKNYISALIFGLFVFNSVVILGQTSSKTDIVVILQAGLDNFSDVGLKARRVSILNRVSQGFNMNDFPPVPWTLTKSIGFSINPLKNKTWYFKSAYTNGWVKDDYIVKVSINGRENNIRFIDKVYFQTVEIGFEKRFLLKSKVAYLSSGLSLVIPNHRDYSEVITQGMSVEPLPTMGSNPASEWAYNFDFSYNKRLSEAFDFYGGGRYLFDFSGYGPSGFIFTGYGFFVGLRGKIGL